MSNKIFDKVFLYNFVKANAALFTSIKVEPDY